MMLIENDKINEGSPLFYIMIVLSMIGSFDIISEILNDNVNVFSQNLTKKVILWVAVYIQTKSIFYSSLVASCIVLIFPSVFFGDRTSPRLDRICEEKERKNGKLTVRGEKEKRDGTFYTVMNNFN